MPNTMDNFDKIIKEKLESFEVPFNEAHWADMEAKLNKNKVAKITKAIFGTAAIVAIVIVSAIYFTESSSEKTNETSTIIVEKAQPTTATNQPTEEVKPTKKSAAIKSKSNTALINELTKSEQTEENDLNVSEKISSTDNVIENKTQNETTTEKQNSIEPEKTQVRFEVFNPIVCLEQLVYFKAYAEGNDLIYNWNFGDGTTSDEIHPKHTYKADGIYDVTLSVTNSKTKKTYTNTQNSVVTILPIAKQDFNYTEQSLQNDKNKVKYPYTTLSVDAKNVKAFVWDAGNGKISTESTPAFLFEKAGVYPIKATFTHQSGCEVTFTKNIEVQQNFDLLAPTGIEPNNANKERATFLPKALYTWDIKFEIVITDKFGNEVYTTTDNKKPWNGKLNNAGEVLPEGVYVWKATTFDVNGVAHYHSGTVKLIAD